MKYIKVCIKLLILIIFTLALSVYFSIVFSPDDKNLKTTFQSIPEDKLDILVLGSSHTQYGINPAVIHNEIGLYSYINASGCQPIPASYYMLKESLKTQKPKLVVLDVFTMLPAKSVCHADSVYKMAADEMSGLEKIMTINQIEDKSVVLDYIFGVRMYHQRWDEVKLSDFILRYEDIDYSTFGYIFLDSKDKNFRYIDKKEANGTYKLKEEDISYLEKVRDLCKKNNIDLLLVKTPFDMDQTNTNALNEVWKQAKKLNIDYLDLFDYQEEMDFAFGYDSETWHNTSWGAYKNSQVISKYISDNYKINHNPSKEIDDKLDLLKNDTLYSQLDGMVDPYRFIDIASKFKNISVIQYKGSKKTSITKAENDLLNQMGMDHNFIHNKNLNYLAIIENGEVISESYGEKLSYKGIEVDMKNISYNDEAIDVDGELNIVVFSNSLNWHKETSIDYASKWFWKKGCDGWKCR